MKTHLAPITFRTSIQNDSKSKKKLKPISKETLTSSKTYNLLPCIKKANNKIFNGKGSDLLINPQYNDPNDLKQQLNTCKAKIIKYNRNFWNLKIKYGKLYSENLSNKNIISNILGVPLDICLTKEQVLDKIESAKVDDLNKEILQIAIDSIILREEIEIKKEKIKKLENYLKELEDNSKTKRTSELMRNYISKCEEQRNLLRILKALEEKNNSFETANQKLNENLEKEINNKKETMKLKDEKMSVYENLILEKKELSKENKTLDEKIKRNAINNKDKEDQNTKTKIEIGEMTIMVEDLESYTKERENNLKHVEEKQNLVDDLKKIKKEQEDNLKQLTKERDKLDLQKSEYDMERPRLIKKSKESRSDIEKMKKLEKELTEVKNEIKNIKEVQEGKKKKLNEITEKHKEESSKNEENKRKNESEKNELNQKIEQLKQKIKSLEEQKESQKESALIALKENNKKIKEENEKLKSENDKLQQEMKEYDEQLKEYKKVENELKNAEKKLGNLK